MSVVWLEPREVEEQINGCIFFSRFVRLGMVDEVPDSTTLCRFQTSLVKAGGYDSLLSKVNR